MSACNCLHPVRILHPSYLSFAVVSDSLCLIDVEYNDSIFFHCSSDIRGKLMDGYNFYHVFNIPKGHHFSLDSYFLNSHTGETFPVFMDVPCGKCDACKAHLQSGLIQRLNFGFEEDTGTSLYVTLTYNDKYLPSLGVCRRDIQLFKKRLNKLAFNLFGVRLKYGYFSEYGDDSRPHYHMLIFGFPPNNKGLSSYEMFRFYSRLLQFCWRRFPKRGYSKAERFDFDNYLRRGYSWFNIRENDKNKDPFSMGFVNVEFPNSSDCSCFSYISKYVSKSSNVPQGKNKNFYNISNNLGLSWVKSRIDNIRKSDSKFLYRSKYSDKVKEVYLSSYYIHKLFPSLSKLVPIEFRRGWLDFHYSAVWIAENENLPTWYRMSALTLLDNVHKRFPSLCPILDFKVDSAGHIVYSYTFNRESWLDDVSDDFFKSFIDRYKFLMSFPENFEKYVSELVFRRDDFLKNYNKFSVDPLLSALKFSKTQNRYNYTKKF